MKHLRDTLNPTDPCFQAKKLDVLHVPVMVLQLVANIFQLSEDPGHHLWTRGWKLTMPALLYNQKGLSGADYRDGHGTPSIWKPMTYPYY